MEILGGLSLLKNFVAPESYLLLHDREHFSNADISNLRIVGTCDILVYRMRHQIM